MWSRFWISARKPTRFWWVWYNSMLIKTSVRRPWVAQQCQSNCFSYTNSNKSPHFSQLSITTVPWIHRTQSWRVLSQTEAGISWWIVYTSRVSKSSWSIISKSWKWDFSDIRTFSRFFLSYRKSVSLSGFYLWELFRFVLPVPLPAALWLHWLLFRLLLIAFNLQTFDYPRRIE